mgnify:CR=1 FL=1
MYYVNTEQIEARLQFLPTVIQALKQLSEHASSGAEAPLLVHLAQERTLILAIEAVTDVGSFLIDGFMMRDASSYEDIVDVLRTEGVLPDDDADGLKSLIALRRPLMQEYMDWPRETLRDDLAETAERLERFRTLVRRFIEKELKPFM